MESPCEEKGLNHHYYIQIAIMSVRRSRRVAGLQPSEVDITTNNKSIVVRNNSSSSQVTVPNIMQMISQYLFFLVWTTFLLRGVLLR
jgi:hypothetical protein